MKEKTSSSKFKGMVTALLVSIITVVWLSLPEASVDGPVSSGPASGYEEGSVLVTFGSGFQACSLSEFEGYPIIDCIEELNTAQLAVPAGSEEEAVAVLEDHPEVDAAEVNGVYYALYTPNDPLFPEQWNLEAINCPAAWDIQMGNSGVVTGIVITVVDTGIDYNHPDLQNHYAPLKSRDFFEHDFDPMDDNGHGTHVAGIAAAEIDNLEGIAGVANVRIAAVKVLGAGGYGFTFTVARGIVFAANHGADIINMSLGGGDSPLVKLACSYAALRGKLLVAAAGNDYGSINYPAAYDTVIAVGAVEPSLERAPFSSYGPELEIMAPGTGILSCLPGGLYDTLSGTSMAAPHVSGCLALYYSEYGRRPIKARTLLHDTADDRGEPGHDEYYGWGLLDCEALLEPPEDNSCFVGGTPVTMADGSRRPIESLAPGDMALAYDLVNRVTRPARVIEVMRHGPEEMGEYFLLINRQLGVTPNHMLLVNGKLMRADRVRVSDRIGSALGEGMLVRLIEEKPSSVPTYNIKLAAPEGGGPLEQVHAAYLVGGPALVAYPIKMPFDMIEVDELFELVEVEQLTEQAESASGIWGTQY
jgi:hypothetical protein